MITNFKVGSTKQPLKLGQVYILSRVCLDVIKYTYPNPDAALCNLY